MHAMHQSHDSNNMYGCPEPYIEWICALRIKGWGWYFGDHPILLLLVPEPLLKAINRRGSSLGCVPTHLPSLRTELDCLSFRFTRVGVARTQNVTQCM